MEEKIVNDILCHKEGNEWIPYTLESLTVAFTSMRAMYESTDLELKRLKNIIEKIGDNVKDYYGMQF